MTTPTARLTTKDAGAAGAASEAMRRLICFRRDDLSLVPHHIRLICCQIAHDGLLDDAKGDPDHEQK